MKQTSNYPPRGYDPGKGLLEWAKEMDLQPHDIVKLDANENLFIPKSFLTQLMIKTAREIDPRFYGIDEAKRLKTKLGEFDSVSEEGILLGSGADQLIDLVIRAFATNSKSVVSIAPSFSMYRECAYRNGNPFEEIPLLASFELDMDGLLENLIGKTGVCFICSPNNPTANQFPVSDIREICEAFNGIVVIDETYVEFADQSAKQLLSSNSNMIIMRTFSKAWGLAGLRLGYLIASSNLIDGLNSGYQFPYPTSIFAMVMAEKLLDLSKYIIMINEEVKKERSVLIQRLSKIDGIRPFPSQANFILFSTSGSSLQLQQRLMREGIIVRNLGRVLGHDNCLRIAIPPREIRNRLIDLLEGMS